MGSVILTSATQVNRFNEMQIHPRKGLWHYYLELYMGDIYNPQNK
jgi:hypothetical protein